MIKMRVVVIGAGVSGLVSIKECAQAGINVTCLEQSSDLGGLWRYTPLDAKNGTTPHSSLYKSIIINSSKGLMGLSDFPPPSSWPEYMPHELVLKYFQMYAEHLDLRRYIKFNRQVVAVRPLPKHKGATQKWLVVSKDMVDGSNKEIEETYDYVMVASGHHHDPLLATFPGQETFPGTIMHTHSYKEPDVFRDQTVVVVGVGNSSCDIATELPQKAKQVYLSSRSGTWIAPRLFLGRPIDRTASRLVNKLLPLWLQNILYETLTTVLIGHPKKFGLAPSHRISQAHLTLNSFLHDRIASGKVIPKPNISKMSHRQVYFDDGSVVEADAIIMGTGYKVSYPFLDKEVLGQGDPHNPNQTRLYKLMFPLHHENLAVIGLIQPLGAIMPLSELQARAAVQHMLGALKLPSISEMEKEVRRRQEAMARRYRPSARHTVQVDFVSYADELAELVGCMPNLKRMLWRDPRLFLACLLAPFNTHQYRLEGPGAVKGARDLVLTTW